MFKKVLGSKAYAISVLLLISGWIHIVGVSVDKLGHSTISNTAIVIQLLVYLLGGLGVLCHYPTSLQLLKTSWLWSVFIFFSCSSLLWADNIYYTTSRLVGMLGIVTIGLLLANCFTVINFIKWLFGIFVVLCLANYIIIYFFPEIGMRSSHVWKGIFFNENQLGLTVIIFWVIGLIQLRYNRMNSIVKLLLVVLVTTPLVYFSSSTMGYVVLIVSILAILSLSLYYKYSFSMYYLILIMILLSLFVYLFYNDILVVLGKNTTLSGRVIIWDLFYDQVKMAPYLGHGYGTLPEANIQIVKEHYKSFYTIMDKMIPYYYQGYDNTVEPNIKLLTVRYAKFMSIGAHNGYLDLLFWFGWSGFILFVAVIVDIVRKLFILLKNKYSQSSIVFLIVYTVMFLMVNLGESQMLVRSGLVWTIFVFVVFKVNELYAEFSKKSIS